MTYLQSWPITPIQTFQISGCNVVQAAIQIISGPLLISYICTVKLRFKSLDNLRLQALFANAVIFLFVFVRCSSGVIEALRFDNLASTSRGLA